MEKLLKREKKISFKEAGGKVVKFFTNKRGYVAVGFFVVAIAMALYLNWTLTNPDVKNNDYVNNLFENENDKNAGTVDSDKPTEVSNPLSDPQYFVNAKLTKTKARDESVEILKAIIDNELASAESRDTAAGEMASIATSISVEANIESLLAGKGFTEAMATVTNESATIMVRYKDITGAHVAQIKDIVLTETGINVDKIKVSEVK